MTLYDHPLRFSHTQIADAADRMAEEIFASIDHTKLDRLREQLDEELENAIEYACGRSTTHFADAAAGSYSVVAHQMPTHDAPERAAVLTIPASLFESWRQEKFALSRKREKVGKLKQLAASYRNAQEYEDVSLTLEDIHELGLDREQAAA